MEYVHRISVILKSYLHAWSHLIKKLCICIRYRSLEVWICYGNWGRRVLEKSNLSNFGDLKFPPIYQISAYWTLKKGGLWHFSCIIWAQTLYNWFNLQKILQCVLLEVVVCIVQFIEFFLYFLKEEAIYHHLRTTSLIEIESNNKHKLS